MDYVIENGNLVFTMDEEDRATWKAELAEQEYLDIEDVFYDSGLGGNCDLDTVQPHQIGALTDSPIFAEAVEYDPGGVIGATGNVWWFPDYQVINPLETLLETGRVVFKGAPENVKTP